MRSTALLLATAKPLFDWVGLLKVFGISIAFALVTVVLVSFTVRLSAAATSSVGAKRFGALALAIVFAAGVAAIVIYGIVIMMSK